MPVERSSCPHSVTTTPQSAQSPFTDEERRVSVCLCGRCSERARSRAGEARSQALRLAQASVRAHERGDPRRSAAYARQAAAAVAEARQCERALPHSPGFLERVAAALVATWRAPRRCARLPQKWPVCLESSQDRTAEKAHTWRRRLSI